MNEYCRDFSVVIHRSVQLHKILTLKYPNVSHLDSVLMLLNDEGGDDRVVAVEIDGF